MAGAGLAIITAPYSASGWLARFLVVSAGAYGGSELGAVAYEGFTGKKSQGTLRGGLQLVGFSSETANNIATGFVTIEVILSLAQGRYKPHLNDLKASAGSGLNRISGDVRDATSAEMDFAHEVAALIHQGKVKSMDKILDPSKIQIAQRVEGAAFYNPNTGVIFMSEEASRNIRVWFDEMGHLLGQRGHGLSYTALLNSRYFKRLSPESQRFVRKINEYWEFGIDIIEKTKKGYRYKQR